jgi:FixJ family two-component response regulator
MGGKGVAIIEDDASANRALGRFMRSAGLEPTGFDSAESFLADERRSSFGCVLVNLQLKGMSGLELQRQLLALGNRIPLIFITAHEDLAAREEAMRRGCAGFFRNTDPGALLLDAVRRAIAATGAQHEPTR